MTALPCRAQKTQMYHLKNIHTIFACLLDVASSRTWNGLSWEGQQERLSGSVAARQTQPNIRSLADFKGAVNASKAEVIKGST